MSARAVPPAGPVLPAEALREMLAAGVGVVILDARGRRADYDLGHLPGARYADPNADLSAASAPGADPAKGGRHPLPAADAWRRTLGEWGITQASFVVTYDDQAGANAAARAWWMLRSVGHERAAVLDGGLEAARAAGIPATAEVPAVASAPPYPAGGWRWPTADIEAVDERRGDRSRVVLDVRSRPRFAGEVEPIDPVAGHIPGAVNVPFTENLRDGRFRPSPELRAMYEEVLGGVSPDRLVVHCGSGVTACHTLLALAHAGMGGAALYVGSWSEWCRSGRPVAGRETERRRRD